MFWPRKLQHNWFLNSTQYYTIIPHIKEVAEIGMREKIDAVHRERGTPCARHDKTFYPFLGEDGKSNGVVYKIRWRNAIHEQLELSQGILSRWLVPLSSRHSRHRRVAQIEKQNAMAIIEQKPVIW